MNGKVPNGVSRTPDWVIGFEDGEYVRVPLDSESGIDGSVGANAIGLGTSAFTPTPMTAAELAAYPTAGLVANVSRAYVYSPAASKGDYLWDGAAWIPLVMTEVTPYVTLSATGTAFTGPCELAGFDCTVAAGNITIYDNTSATGTVIVPTTALAVGRTEFAYKRYLTTGCHVVLSGAATVNVLVG